MSEHIGNGAKMHEALKTALDLILPQCNGGTAFAKACNEVANKIIDALAAPPRNCDHYKTPEEADEAFRKLCRSHISCMGCQCLYFKESCKATFLYAEYNEKKEVTK